MPLIITKTANLTRFFFTFVSVRDPDLCAVDHPPFNLNYCLESIVYQLKFDVVAVFWVLL